VQLADSAFGLDVAARKPFDISWSAQKEVSQAFDLQTADRAVLSEKGKHAQSAIVSVKTGKPISELNFLADEIHVATNTRYAIVSNFNADSVVISAFDLDQNRPIEAPPSTAMDIFGDVLAVRTEFGSIVLYRLSDHRLLRSLRLPPGNLPALRAASVSPDFETLAFSVDGIGALYRLSSGQRIATMQKFNAGNFSSSGDLFVYNRPSYQFPARVLRLDHSNGSLTPAWEVDKKVGLYPSGSFALEYLPELSGFSPWQTGDPQMQVPFRLRGLDLSNGSELWKKDYSIDPPTPFANPQGENVVLGWRAKSSGAKSAAGKNMEIKNIYKSAKLNDLDSFFEVLDSKTGKSLGGVLVQVGSGAMTFDGAFAEGDALILIKDGVRVSIYSISDGKLKARLVGLRPSASAAGNLLALDLERGHLGIFDLMAGVKLDEQILGEDIAYTHFSEDGKKLLVLTESQLVYLFDVSEAHKNQISRPQ
jgi:WD40 repeat protein